MQSYCARSVQKIAIFRLFLILIQSSPVLPLNESFEKTCTRRFRKEAFVFVKFVSFKIRQLKPENKPFSSLQIFFFVLLLCFYNTLQNMVNVKVEA